MIIRLFAFIFGYVLLFSIPLGGLGYVAYRALEPYRKRRHARKLAEHHAKQLKAHDEQLCFHCLEPCDENDCYESGKGWYHEKCLKALLD